jgi:hypothetical protein
LHSNRWIILVLTLFLFVRFELESEGSVLNIDTFCLFSRLSVSRSRRPAALRTVAKMSNESSRKRSLSGSADQPTESEDEFSVTPRQSSGSSDGTTTDTTAPPNLSSTSQTSNRSNQPQRRLRKKPFDFKLDNDDTLLHDISPKLKVTEEDGFQPLMHKPTKRVQHFEETGAGNKKRKTSSGKRNSLTTGLWLVCTGLAAALLAKAVHVLHETYYKASV